MRIHSLVTAALVMLGITGCATAPTAVAPKADEGTVVVQLIGVQPLSAFASKWTSLRLTNKTTGSSVTLTDQAALGASHSLFAGPLPPGKYEVAEFSSTGPTPFVPGVIGLLPAFAISAMTSESQATSQRLGTFTVSAGKLTNLGVIVSSLPPESGGAPVIAVLADDRAKASAFESMRADQKAALSALPVAIGWDVPVPVDANEKALDLVRRYSQNVSSIEVVEASNRVLIGGLLGVIHSKSGNGPWTGISTGTLDTISYLKSLDDGTLIAGSDSSRLLVQQKDGTWRSSILPRPRFRVIRIEPLGSKGFAIVAANQEFKSPFAVVYFKEKLDTPGDFVEWLKYDDPSAGGRYPVYFDGTELLAYFGHQGFARTADLHRINVATQAKSVSKLGYWVFDIYRLSDSLVVINRENALSSYNSFSSDYAKTWRHPDFVVPMSSRYRDPMNAYGFKTESMGWSINKVALYKTTNGGQSWSVVGTPIEGLGIMPIRYLGNTLYVFTGQKLLSTVDEGKTWRTEWPQR